MEITLELILVFLATGVAAGFVAGFVGVGGGIIMVPVLLEVFRSAGVADDSVVQAAMATSLSVAFFSTISSAIRHGRQGRVRWALVPWLAPGSLAGGWFAAWLAARSSGSVLQGLLAAVLVFGAVRMITGREPVDHPDRRPRPVVVLAVGVLVGMVAGLSGLAGGVVLVPALSLLLGVPGGWLAGTSSGTLIFSALAATVGYMLGQPPSALGPGFTGYVCLSLTGPLALGAIPAAQAGAWANRRVGGTLFRRIFGVLLILVVIRLVLTI